MGMNNAMNNQSLLWASFLISWFSVIFLKKEEVKRYIPVALFGVLISTFIIEMGTRLNWWLTKETVFPLVNMPIFVYGSFLVGILWIFKCTYKRFWLFLATNAVIDLILMFPLNSWFIDLGIFERYSITPFQMFLIAISQAIILYGFQLWQTGELKSSTPVHFVPNVQTAARKPHNDDDE